VVTAHAPSEDSGTDWRRLASDRNVSYGVARALWEQARAAAPDDPVQAEHAFHVLLGEAEAANLTQEPGRETLADSTAGARDAASAGPGKWTRVLTEQPRPAGAAVRGAETPRPRSAEALRNELVAAGQASKNAAAILAASDPATILEALRELADRQGPGALHKVMSMASGAVERLLGQGSQAPQTQTGSAARGANPGDRAVRGTPDRAPAAQPADRRR
jgi:hypothetical protein